MDEVVKVLQSIHAELSSISFCLIVIAITQIVRAFKEGGRNGG